MSRVLKTFGICVLLLPFSAWSAEECIFDEVAYLDFLGEYAATHADAAIQPDGKSLVVRFANEEVLVEGGGCIHLGMSITAESSQTYDENQFLQKVLGLSTEFGAWLLDTDELNEAIQEKSWERINGAYYFYLNELTVFEASLSDKGSINIHFYIN